MPAVMSSDVQSGLSAAEARSRLERDGFNELPAAGKRSAAKIAGEVVREPMFALLIAAAVIYAVLGERGEALMLLAFATISVSIAIVQQGRSEKALHALRELTSPRALVVRDGQRIRMLFPIAAPSATRPAAAAIATTGDTWIDFFHQGSAICGRSAGKAAMICALT